MGKLHVVAYAVLLLVCSTLAQQDANQADCASGPTWGQDVFCLAALSQSTTNRGLALTADICPAFNSTDLSLLLFSQTYASQLDLSTGQWEAPEVLSTVLLFAINSSAQPWNDCPALFDGAKSCFNEDNCTGPLINYAASLANTASNDTGEGQSLMLNSTTATGIVASLAFVCQNSVAFGDNKTDSIQGNPRDCYDTSFEVYFATSIIETMASSDSCDLPNAENKGYALRDSSGSCTAWNDFIQTLPILLCLGLAPVETSALPVTPELREQG